MLAQYVGGDSKYTLASNHAAITVRELSRAPDFLHRLKEATAILTLIDGLIEFVLLQEHLKSEQKGCLALRV